MKKSHQYTLSKEMMRETECGGDYSKGKRKTRRPFSSKHALHIVCRSEIAKGEYSLLLSKNKRLIEEVISSLAARFGIKIYDKATNSNHLHLLIRATSKQCLSNFLRAFPGTLAMRITGAKRGKALLKKFWTNRIWSRIVSFGKEFYTVKNYLTQNTLEALGIIPYTPRNKQKCRSPAR